jgi:mono/diheme cytochrome c family protein
MAPPSSASRRVAAALIAGSVAALAGVAVWVLVEARSHRGPTAADASDTRLVALGEGIYRDHCAACHGADLEGQPEWRVRGAEGRLPAPPHDETGHTWHHPDEQLFAITKYGIEAFAPPGYETDMPAFAGVLTDEEIWGVLAYIKSRWPQRIRDLHDDINRRASR